MQQVKKAVIPAAGIGTRFLPVTKSQPKEMLPLIDKPIIQFVIEEAAASGIKDIIIVTGRGKRAIEDHFDIAIELEQFLKKSGHIELKKQINEIAKLANIHYIRQKEPLGLGHAVLCAKDHIGNEPFAVLLGDDYYASKIPVTKQLINIYNKTSSSAISVIKTDDPKRYGIIGGKQIDPRLWLIKELVEKPEPSKAPSNMAISGRYIFTPEIFSCLEKVKPGHNGEIQLTDAMVMLKDMQNIYAYLLDEKRYDIGTKLEYYKAFVEYGLQHPEIAEQVKAFIKSFAGNLK